MNCPFCGAELPDGAELCPVCGKALNEENAAEETAAPEETASEQTAGEETAGEETAGEEAAAESAEDPNAWRTCSHEEPCEQCPERETCLLLQEHTAQEAEKQLSAEKTQKKQKSKKLWTRIGIIAGSCIVLAAAVFFIYKAVKGPTIVHENSAGYTSYTMTDKQASNRVLDRVVATCGDEKLTNRMLSFYYWQQYYSFANNYSSYLSYILDTSKGLDEQMYDDKDTWQKKFLDSAITMFEDIAALNQEAAKAGFTLDQDTEDYLATISDNLDSAAQQAGLESGEAYLQKAFGSGATMDDYLAYARTNLTASAYLQTLVDKKTYTEDDVSAYFDENAENYTSQGVEKDDTPMVDVRHILIIPSEKNDDGTFTDAAWADAKEQAETLLQQWKDDGGTEDAFATLATANSADSGSASNGGLITGVYPGEMVEDFNSWCFAAGRKVGDCEIVKSEYGYHIIYFSAVEAHAHWYSVAEADYKNKLSMDVEDEILAKYTTTVNYENAAIVNVLASENAAEQSAAEQAAASAATEAGSSTSADTSAAGSAASGSASSSAG